ncbi:MAG TPA: isoamylase early set domain-containing protein [Acidimicrobiales bacterium]|jgi:1,4-alpha-glucan branching enzyme|nr:isoamylase early set domain-containing protein [Acidimicrobiales bacterium]
MARKLVSKGGRTSRVTFELPPDIGAEQVQLCGEFNGWSTTATPLAPRKDGRFSVTLTLPTGSAYRYRFLVDGQRWENDWSADEYVQNGFGGDDSVLRL